MKYYISLIRTEVYVNDDGYICIKFTCNKKHSFVYWSCQYSNYQTPKAVALYDFHLNTKFSEQIDVECFDDPKTYDVSINVLAVDRPDYLERNCFAVLLIPITN